MSPVPRVCLVAIVNQARQRAPEDHTRVGCGGRDRRGDRRHTMVPIGTLSACATAITTSVWATQRIVTAAHAA